jgi:hypothetical protein
MMTTKEIIEKAEGRKTQSSPQVLQFYYETWINWWDTVVAPAKNERLDRIEKALKEEGFI